MPWLQQVILNDTFLSERNLYVPINWLKQLHSWVFKKDKIHKRLYNFILIWYYVNHYFSYLSHINAVYKLLIVLGVSDFMISFQPDHF